MRSAVLTIGDLATMGPTKRPSRRMVIRYPQASAGTSLSDRRNPVVAPDVASKVLVGPGVLRIVRTVSAKSDGFSMSRPIHPPQQLAPHDKKHGPRSHVGVMESLARTPPNRM